VTIAVVGEILWDVFPDAERLGGASFNFAAHAARLGHRVLFLSAVGDDAHGRAARAHAEALGLDTAFIQTAPDAATGIVTVSLDAGGHPDYVIHRPAAYDFWRFDARVVEASPEWVYFGTLHQALPQARAETQRLLAALPGASRFYDVNFRRDCYTPELARELLAEAHVVKLNDHEAIEIAGLLGHPWESIERFTARAAERFGWRAVAVTRGAEGCAIRIGLDYAEPPGVPVQVVDTVGAGDAFAAAFVHGLGQGWDAAACGAFANRLGAEVASQAGAVN
jgi:fructokinase